MTHETVRPIEQIEPALYHFSDDGAIPNHPHFPLIIYPGVLRLSEPDPAAACETVFIQASWGSTWRNSIYAYHHYHSEAHEVLAIARGQAQVHFGGEQGEILTVRAGDVALIPAGVGHKNLGASSDFLVVGAYPPGQRPDMRRGEPHERPAALHNIQAVPYPPADPVYGQTGPLYEHWPRQHQA